MEWRPEKHPYHVVLAQRDRGLTTLSMIVLDEFTELAPIEEAELDPLCISCSKGGGDSMDPDLFQCERCLQWILVTLGEGGIGKAWVACVRGMFEL